MRFFVLLLGLVGLGLVCACSSKDGAPGGTDADVACQGITWKPEGCRSVFATHPVLPPRTASRNFHSGPINTDEFSIAMAPQFEVAWTAEEDTFNATGPVFDANGNVYLTPLLPFEDVVLISIRGEDGSRRWAIPGTDDLPGGGTAMILNDPENPGAELVYLGLYERVLAVTTDGEVVWDEPTGLVSAPLPPGNFGPATFGVNFHPGLDAIVGLTQDGYIYVHRRTDGTRIFAPFKLPGDRSPAVPTNFPPGLVDNFREAISEIISVPEGADPAQILNVILGNETVVANFFSIDPHSSRLWIAATAPDAEDGNEDGVSNLGALYGFDIVDKDGSLTMVQACHRYFDGGSASTPALRADGLRVYVADNDGKLIAVDRDCKDLWEFDVGSQIVGSIAVSSDNGEVYATTAEAVVKVIDRDGAGVEAWRTNLDMYEADDKEQNLNLLLAGIGANGVSFQGGFGLFFMGQTRNVAMAQEVGVGLLDRETGKVRHFAAGLDESVSAMMLGPKGEIYSANSAIRRLLRQAGSVFLGVEPGPPVVGGVTKFGRTSLDDLLTDVACVARDRSLNAAKIESTCPDSAAADAVQLGELIDQARGAGPEAVAAGDLSAAKWTQVDTALTAAEAALASPETDFAAAAEAFGQAASAIASAEREP